MTFEARHVSGPSCFRKLAAGTEAADPVVAALLPGELAEGDLGVVVLDVH